MEELINKFLTLGSGYGYGSGSGSGSGSGDGDGYGDGVGSGSGDGFGVGSGDGVSLYNRQKVYLIDDIQTIIESVKGDYAKVHTLQSDLTLKPCFIARIGDYFAHGETLKAAVRDAQSKYNQNLSEEKRIEMFVEQFEEGKKYPAKLFFDWHNILTGSCDYGRKEFCRERGIDVDNDVFTVTEFFNLTKNSYGKDIIINLMSRF